MSMHGRRVSPREVAVGVIALAWALFHLYTAGFGLLPNLIQRSIHFAGAMVLLCLTLPVLRRGNGLAGTLFNGFLIAVTIVTTAYVVLRYDVIVAMQGQYTTFETVLGFLVLLLVLEGSRRSFGWVFPILVLAFVAYAFFGPLFPGIWAHPGITPGRFADVLYRGTQGLWGFLMSVSATVIAVFILYGNVLLLTGGGEAFFDLAKA
ncbi:MAG: TRAP transporter large permease subunit, partial [Clostridia bacterium]|nr:TRAP transporter large permease subunit [Clostridia bacterium]